MKIGYARVSTIDQNVQLQIDALKEAGCERFYEDKISGVKFERPGLNQALHVARSGDVLVVWRLDRLGRSLKDLIVTVEILQSQGIELQSLHEGITTNSSGGKLVFHLFGALAEFERELIRERSQAGIEAARARGIVGGRRKALDADKRKLAVQLYHEGKHSIAEVCKLMGVSKPTLYKYIKKEV